MASFPVRGFFYVLSLSPMTRLAKPLTPAIRDLIASLHGLNVPKYLIAAACGVHRDHLHKWEKKHPDLVEAMAKARAKTIRGVSSALIEQALGKEYHEEVLTKDGEVVQLKKYRPGTTAAAVKVLQCMAPETWTDTQKVEISNLDTLLETIVDKTRELPSKDDDTEKFREKYITH